MRWKQIAVFGLASLTLSLVASGDARAGINYVQNGGFELAGDGISASQIGQVGVSNVDGYTTTLYAWQLGTTPAAVDVADQNYDTSGVPTVSGHGTIWSGAGVIPGTTFTGSPDGGNFLASDADTSFEPSPVFQTISGLTAGQQYTLSFDWAAGQAQPYNGAVSEWWMVTFGTLTSYTSASTTPYNNPSHGFSGWEPYSTTFTANSSTQILTFIASASVAGVPPVLMLDGVSLTASVPEPSSLVIAGIGTCGVVVIGWLRRRSTVKI